MALLESSKKRMNEAENSHTNLINTIESKKKTLNAWDEMVDKPKNSDVYYFLTLCINIILASL